MAASSPTMAGSAWALLPSPLATARAPVAQTEVATMPAPTSPHATRTNGLASSAWSEGRLTAHFGGPRAEATRRDEKDRGLLRGCRATDGSRQSRSRNELLP